MFRAQWAVPKGDGVEWWGGMVESTQIASPYGAIGDFTGLAQSGLGLAHAISTLPTVAHTNSVWDWSGLAIMGKLHSLGSSWASPAGPQPGNHGPNRPWLFLPDHGLIMGQP